MRRDDKILVSGYAKLPAHITSEEVFHTAVVVLVIDMQMGTILNTECSMATELGKKFVADLLVGYNMDNGPEPIISRFDRVYYGQAKKAIITALKMIFAKYEEIIAEEEQG